MTEIAQQIKTYKSNARRWLGSRDGIEFTVTETVDLTKCVDGTHYDSTSRRELVDGLVFVYDPADTTKVVPADVEPTGEYAGVLYTGTNIDASLDAGATTIGVGLLVRCVLVEQFLPIPVPTAVRDKAKATGVRFRDV